MPASEKTTARNLVNFPDGDTIRLFDQTNGLVPQPTTSSAGSIAVLPRRNMFGLGMGISF